MKFRGEALARAQSTEALDLPVRLTSPRGWIVLVTVAAVVLGGGTWAFAGSLPRSINAPGLLTSSQGSFTIETVAAGQIVRVFVKQGSVVAANAAVAVVTDGQSYTVVRSPAQGRIFSLTVRVGQVVQAASTLAVAEHVGNAANWIVAVLYLPSAQGAGVAPGDNVDLTVDSVSVTAFGVLRGRVASVDPLLSTRREAADFLGDAGLAQTLTADPARRIVVELERSAATASGYEWSTNAGPPFRLGSRTGVAGAIAQPPVRPVEWVFPR
jgi:pyruvate/2-oxoglutarate dehydrogenase complex dihydrolipoamide acyltransferase (E2) component